MADSPNDPQNQNPGNNGGEGGGNGGDGFKPVTYSTQAEMDAAFADRAKRAADSAKAEALKVFTDAGVSAEDALEAYNAQKAEEEAKKGPEAKERERAEHDRAELRSYKAKEARDKLAKEVSKDLKFGDTPIPAELLAGTTKEEITAHGAALLAFIEQLAGQQGPRAPQHNPLQGHNGQDKVNAGDPLRNFFTTGSFQ